jgi:hypothetical protein
MRSLLFLILILLSGCKGSDPELAPLGNIQTPPAYIPPETHIYALSAYVSNSAGSTLTLTNGPESVVVSGDGSYIFPTRLAFNDSYNVTVSSPTMNCSVKNGLGTAKSNVGNIEVKCAPLSASYIQGAVQGFSSGSIILKLEIGGVQVEQITVTPDKTSYGFSNYVTNGSAYRVSIVSKPSTIDCTVERYQGTINGNLSDINLICNPSSSQTYTVSGVITGLPVGKKLTLWDSSNNGSNETLYTGTGTSQSFSVTNFIQGRRYVLELAKSDSDVHCFFPNGTYKTAAFSTTNVSSLNITCQPRTIGACGAFTGELPYNLDLSKIVCENDQVYMAGDSIGFGKYLGGGWTSQITDNNPSPRKTFDRIRGTVNVAIPDGSGGWYVGGSFNYVGDVAMTNIAHLYSDLTVDEGFKVNVNGAVSAIVRKGFMLYFGGAFTSVSVPGTATLLTKGLAALDLSTSPYSMTNLALNIYSGSVLGIALTDSNLIVHGSMRETSSSGYVYLEKIPLASSAISTLTNPYASSYVAKIKTFKEVDGTWAIIFSTSGRSFYKVQENSSTPVSIVGGVEWNWDLIDGKIYVAAAAGVVIYNPVTLTIQSTFSPLITGTSFNTEMTSNSTAFCLSGPSFTIAGTVGARKGLACFDASAGTVLGNSSNLFPDAVVAMSETQLYIPTSIATSSLTYRTSLLKFGLATRAADASFASSTTLILALELDATHVYISGLNKIQRLIKTTGVADTFFDADTSIMNSKAFEKLYRDDDYLYIIGSGKLYRKSMVDGSFILDPATNSAHHLYNLAITENVIYRHYYETNAYKLSSQAKSDYGTATLINQISSTASSIPFVLSGDRIISGSKILTSSLVDETAGYLILGSQLGIGENDLLYRIQSNIFYEDDFSSAPLSTSLPAPVFTPKTGLPMGVIQDGSLWQFSNQTSVSSGWYNTTDTHPFVKVMKID